MAHRIRGAIFLFYLLDVQGWRRISLLSEQLMPSCLLKLIN